MLSEQMKGVVQSQLEEINLVQRNTNEHTHVALYKMRPFFYDQTRRMKLPTKGEFEIASMHFVANGSKHYVRLFGVEGNVFSLEFNRDIRGLSCASVTEIVKLETHESIT